MLLLLCHVLQLQIPPSVSKCLVGDCVLHFVPVAPPPRDQFFTSGKDSDTSPVFYPFCPVPNSRLLSPSMPLIKALQTCDKLLFLVVNPGFYCFVISCTNVWHFFHLPLLIFPQPNKEFSTGTLLILVVCLSTECFLPRSNNEGWSQCVSGDLGFLPVPPSGCVALGNSVPCAVTQFPSQ